MNPKPTKFKKFPVVQGMQLLAQRNIVENAIDLWAVIHSSDGTYVAAEAIAWAGTSVPEGERIGAPFWKLDYADAQLLMDELHRAGVRPSVVNESGEIARMENHLKDMRDIAMSFIDLKK